METIYYLGVRISGVGLKIGYGDYIVTMEKKWKLQYEHRLCIITGYILGIYREHRVIMEKTMKTTI